MTPSAPKILRLIAFVIVFAIAAAGGAGAADPSAEHPLEPPDRSSPRATLETFLGSIDRAWELYQARDPAVRDVFTRARGCLDLSAIPPLVVHEVSTQKALVLKEVLDRIELPPLREIPDAAEVFEHGLTKWTIPHTEITLRLISEGEHQGEWLFSADTVGRTDEFFARVAHLPYRPGRLGGHVDELRFGTNATLIGHLVSRMPPSMKTEVRGMLLWQWLALGLLVLLLALAAAAAAWLGGRWSTSRIPGARFGVYLFPLMLVATPFVGHTMISRLFQLPGEPALWVKLVFSIVGHIGLAWLVAVLVTRIGNLVVIYGFRNARPLKQQLVRVLFRIAAIVIVAGVVVRAAQSLGVPVAGLIAGLGVGGLAIALAAQSTLENFIGGIILYADQPVKVGDFCSFGDRRGLVEAVGLRSTRIRTLDRTLVTIPNASFAKMQLENLSGRDRILLREKIRLRYETTREQLLEVMEALEAMLRQHPQISDDKLRVRFNGFGDSFQEVELYGYAETGEWPDFTRIREEILLQVIAIVERSPTRLALPTEVHYVHGQQGTQAGT